MKTKRLMAFLLAAVMMMSQTVFVNAQNENKKISLLEKLGIIVEKPEEDFDFDAYITRAEFVSCIVNMLGIDTDSSENAGHFVDVPSDYPYAGVINTAYERGIISSMFDGFFVPEAPLRLEQAAKMVVSMLGYDTLAQSRGGYPEGYLAAASTAGVLKDITANRDGYISYKTAYAILYNALNADMMVTTIEKGEQKVEIRSGETILSSVLKILKAEGQITATPYTSLETTEGVAKGKIQINGVTYDDYSVDSAYYLGYFVDYYYLEDEMAVVAVMPKKSASSVTIRADDILSYRDYTYVYELDGREKKAKISAKTDIIYNGRLVTKDYHLVQYWPLSGSIRLIDGDGDGSYDILDIKSYQTVVANGVLAADMLITDKDDVSRNIEIEDIDDVFLSIKNVQGEEISFQEINRENVLSIAKSLDGIVYDIIVSSNKIDGTVLSVSKDEQGTKVDLDGEEYILSKDRGEFLDIQMGDSGVFWLDAFGYAAYFKKSMSGQYQYGYLHSVYYDEVEELLTAKILDTEGVFNKIISIDKLTYNNLRNQKPDEVYEELKNTKQIIMYMTNSEGKLTKIQTTDGSMLKHLYSSDKASGSKYWSSSRTFDAKIPVADAAIVFVLPFNDKDYGDDIYYSAKKRAYLANNNRYIFESYTSDQKSDFAQVVVTYKKYDTPVVDQGIALVKKIESVVNEADEIVYKLTLLYMGAEFEFFTLNEKVISAAKAENGGGSAITIQAGDIIRFAQSPDNSIEEIKVVFDYSERKYIGALSTGLDAQYRSIFGSVYSIEDKMAKVYVNLSDSTLEYYPVDKFKIYVYDVSGSKPNIYLGNENDILDQAHYGTQFARVIIQTKNGEPAAMVVYKGFANFDKE